MDIAGKIRKYIGLVTPSPVETQIYVAENKRVFRHYHVTGHFKKVRGRLSILGKKTVTIHIMTTTKKHVCI
jgi:hypothetical protein